MNSYIRNYLLERLRKTFPNYVVFVYRDNGIKRHPISRFIDIATSVGVSFVFSRNIKNYYLKAVTN